MKTWILVVVGALLIAAVPTTALVLASHENSGSSASAAGPRHGHGEAHAHGKGHGHAFGQHKKMRPGKGFGAGPGVPGLRGRRGMRHQLQQQWLQQWKSLTPAQKAQKMAGLARQRAAALQAWADCLAKSKTPASCPRPVPPGLAKRS